jgi:hypothetical protein
MVLPMLRLPQAGLTIVMLKELHVLLQTPTTGGLTVVP